jgi:hypothetical protein
VFCSGVAEIALVVDMSGSIETVQNAIRSFSIAFVNSFSVNESEIRFTITAFANTTILNQPLTGDRNKLVGVLSFLSASGGTDITAGVIPAFSNLSVGRSGVPRAMIVLTDGGHNSGGDVYGAIDNVRNAGIPLFAVGYQTSETNEGILRYIDPDARLYSVDQLAGVVGHTVRLICNPNVIQGAVVTEPGENTGFPSEAERGIVRVFDDGIVIARQPNGDLDFYMPDGCMMGRIATSIMSSADLGTRELLHSIEGCGGYRADLWSLGYDFCQLQVNMYGPNGYQKEYIMERNTLHPTCIPAANSLKPSGEYVKAYQYEHYELFFARLQELRESANTALNVVDLLVIDLSDAVDIACAVVPTLELSREFLDGVPSAPDLEQTQSFLCMSIDTVDGLVRGVELAGPGAPLALLEMMINADRIGFKLGATIDEWFLNDLNQWASSAPLTCFLFPDAPICPPR